MPASVRALARLRASVMALLATAGAGPQANAPLTLPAGQRPDRHGDGHRIVAG